MIACVLSFFFLFSYLSSLGRGVIHACAQTVWEAVKNPLSRYIYDNMLKVGTSHQQSVRLDFQNCTIDLFTEIR